MYLIVHSDISTHFKIYIITGMNTSMIQSSIRGSVIILLYINLVISYILIVTGVKRKSRNATYGMTQTGSRSRDERVKL
jgi:hypothetical protein